MLYDYPIPLALGLSCMVHAQQCAAELLYGEDCSASSLATAIIKSPPSEWH